MSSSQKQESASQLINRFLSWASNLGNKGILYRGLADAKWEVSSSLYRRLCDSKYIEQGYQPAEIDQILMEANQQITMRGAQWHNRKNNVDLSILQIWAELQYYGAATILIDFTKNPLVALWFACQNVTSIETDGKVVAIDSSDKNKYKIISENENEKLMEIIKGEILGKWQPPRKNNRIISQHSEFILGKHVIKIDNSFSILCEMKKIILAELEKHDISEEHLFCDFYGFAQINAHNRPYNYHAPRHYVAKANPEYADSYCSRGNAKYASGDYKGAIIDFDKALELNPDAIIYSNRGSAKGKLGDKTGAIMDFDKSLELNPENADTYYNRGAVKDESGDKAGAIIDFDKSLELNPKNATAYNNRGIVKYTSGDYKGAIIDFDKSLELNPNAIIYHSRGSAKSKLGDKTDAIIDFDKALELDPKYVDAYNSRGSAKSKLSNFKGAIIDFNKSLKLNPECATAYNNRGVAKYNLHDHAGALADFKKANELDSTFKIPPELMIKIQNTPSQ